MSTSPQDSAAAPRVILELNVGRVVLDMESERAPRSVQNFLQYVRDGFYDNTIFHRVIPNFVAQGGGFTMELRLKQTRDPIPNEADNGLTNDRGTVSMARTTDPNSATSQFYINLTDNPSLNHTAISQQGWGYAVFARVAEGMELIDKIATVPTGAMGPFQSDLPMTPIRIERAFIEGDDSTDASEQ